MTAFSNPNRKIKNLGIFILTCIYEFNLGSVNA